MSDWMTPIVSTLATDAPVLIAGPTASGKSALAMRIADRTGGIVVNADALQVYSDWRILTARPSVEDEARLPHALYGHVPGDHAYSVGDWLREVTPLLEGPVPVIVGGTGLYFTALTEGLADIPQTPIAIRQEAEARLKAHGPAALLADLDVRTLARVDRQNPVRIQRAWEVLKTTGEGLADWQDRTGPPTLALSDAQAIVLHAQPERTAARSAARFDEMLDAGVIDEARANRPGWAPDRPSAKAIGAAELMLYLDGKIDRETLRERVTILTRQYAKRQRSWFRARMSHWRWTACD